jgi:hypothetical protein
MRFDSVSHFLFTTELYTTLYYHEKYSFENIVIKGGNTGFEVHMPVTVNSILFWVVKLCILERTRCFGEHITSLVFCLACSFILKMEIMYFSEASSSLQSARRYNPKYGNLQSRKHLSG